MDNVKFTFTQLTEHTKVSLNHKIGRAVYFDLQSLTLLIIQATRIKKVKNKNTNSDKNVSVDCIEKQQNNTIRQHSLLLTSRRHSKFIVSIYRLKSAIVLEKQSYQDNINFRSTFTAIEHNTLPIVKTRYGKINRTIECSC